MGFVTCVQLGLSCMEAIYEAGGTLDFAITLPDDKSPNKSGRVFIDDFCEVRGIKLIKSAHINNLVVIEAIKSANIDWLFIIGWSQIASVDVLNAPNKGVLGMHPTLLPKGRGRAAIPWAILNGLEKTGVTLFKMDAGVDTGPIAGQIEIALSPDITATQLYEKVNSAHVQLMRTSVPLLIADKLELTIQDNLKASVWPGRKPEDGEINLAGSVFDAKKLIRAVTHPYPGAFFYKKSKKYIVWSAQHIKNITKKNPNLMYLEFHDGILLVQDFDVYFLEENT